MELQELKSDNLLQVLDAGKEGLVTDQVLAGLGEYFSCNRVPRRCSTRQGDAVPPDKVIICVT